MMLYNCHIGAYTRVQDQAHLVGDMQIEEHVFIGMQAEGREWVRLFSPATVARFDYVFTDAMTLTDGRGP